jgi:hypothetical protein
MIDHPTKAKQYHGLAIGAVERAQLETDNAAQSRIYALAEGYLLLAETELKAARHLRPAKKGNKSRKQRGSAARISGGRVTIEE